MLLLSFVAVFSVGIFSTGEAYQSCTWSKTPGYHIDGGVLASGANTVEACQSFCEQMAGCVSVDFVQSTSGCYTLLTQAGKTSDPTVDHYDRVCVEINPCAANPCQNGGQCSASGKSYTCSCKPGYSGNTCETFNPCALNPCKNGGTCTQSGSSYVCSCLYGYVGSNCESRDSCIPNPCQNGGQCSSSGSSYACTCASGYSGTNCESFNPCSLNPCKNGGTCTQSGSSYVCSCPYGYVGSNCESRDPCIPSPCQNGGSCGKSGSGYTCTCASGYTGTNCEARAVRDLVSSVGDARCFKTNYQGSVYDFWTAPNGVSWNFQAATFGFDWPQTGILFIPLGGFLYIDRITFGGSDNLNSFRVAFTSNFGRVITTNAIGPNARTTILSGVRDVKRVDFYLTPGDFSRDVSLYDVSFKCCIKDPFIGILGTCVLFDLLKNVLQVASLGIIRPGGTSGTFSVTIPVPNPYVELDLLCSGAGTVTFAGVSFGQTNNFYRVSVAVWNGFAVVPVYDQYGVATNYFNNPAGITFGRNVIGNRIRVTIIPVSSQGQAGTIWFSKFSVTGA